MARRQAYPRGFGEAIAKVHSEFRGTMVDAAKQLAKNAASTDVDVAGMFALMGNAKNNVKVFVGLCVAVYVQLRGPSGQTYPRPIF